MSKPGLRNPALALVLAAGMLSAPLALAQESTGAFSGEVGSGDKVTLHNVETGYDREVQIKDDGRFHVRHVPVGNYEVTVHRADGSEFKVMAAARIGTTIRLDLD